MARGRRSSSTKSNGANLGFESTLCAAADKLRNNLDAAEYKHVVLGLIFLKYISDAFEERHAQLQKEVDQGADPEDPDEYRGRSIFRMPKESRWSFLQSNAKQATIGKLVDDAMVTIERDNRSLKGVLPKDYARPALDNQRLGALIYLISGIGLGDAENRSKDILTRVHYYLLGSIVPILDFSHIHTLPVIVPTREVIDIFEKLATTIFNKIMANENQSTTLPAIRDSLLPELLSGQSRTKWSAYIIEGL
jgi:type I restriction-modification system DNA methylase subunit